MLFGQTQLGVGLGAQLRAHLRDDPLDEDL
jgi:hypothetical protein